MNVRIVFACSGSVKNCAAIAPLAAAYQAEVVAMTLDLGQGGDLEVVRHAAIAAGAVRAHVLDVRDEFAREWFASLGSDTEEQPTVNTPVQSVIARKLVEIARIERATGIAHAGDVADHLAIQAAAQALDPAICVIAASAAPPPAEYTVHTTLWGRSIECGSRQPVETLPEAVYSLTAPSARLADLPANVEISFEAGLPVAINGIPMRLTELIESIATIAGHHGVGRVADRAAGIACEAPAAVVFHAARAALVGADLQADAAMVRVELFRGRHRVVSTQHS